MFHVPFSNIRSTIRSFGAETGGNVALFFGLAAIPMMLFAGAAMDYTRAMTEKERLQSSLDATALALAKEPKGTNVTDLSVKANAYFAASFRSSSTLAPPAVTVQQGSSTLTLEVNAQFPTSIMQIAGIDEMPLRARSTVRNVRSKLEIALVLDNTGSMAQAGKMDALKAAVNDLIGNLQTKVVESDDVKLSIVPFNTEVKISTANAAAPWLRWDVTLENPAYGWAQRQPPSIATWQGCIADRDQPYDASSEPAIDHFHRYVASQCHYTGLAMMEPLTTDLELIRARANSMTPTGNTNVTIGFTAGLATLRNDSPFGANASNGANVEKFVILLTDGDNTRNRWSNNSADIDARLQTACTQARASSVKVFTVRVIAGNASLLRNCATQPSMFYDVHNATDLQPVFRKILESIDGIRITA